MMGKCLSLILLPTLQCNADCEYCFENKTSDHLPLDQLSTLIHKVFDHMDRNEIEALTIHWQGGEVMTLPPQWYEGAYTIIERTAETRNKQVTNYIQSNMVGYSKKWNDILGKMFNNDVGSSLDYPNLHRKVAGGTPKEFNEIWFRNVCEARKAGIEVGIISIPNKETLQMGAERFYSYFVDELGITSFQINTPFPGGQINEAKKGYPLETHKLNQFMIDLVDIWMDRGYEGGVRIGPFDILIDYFIKGNAVLPCIWQNNCVNEFVCIDPRGNVSQCDCWVTSYPEFWFGNIFEQRGFSNLLEKSKARQRLWERPGLLIQKEECIDCGYLALCHGGCPIRTYSAYGDFIKKDPYCDTYKSIFGYMEEISTGLAYRSSRSFKNRV